MTRRSIGFGLQRLVWRPTAAALAVLIAAAWMSVGQAADLPKNGKSTANKRASKTAAPAAKSIEPSAVDPMDWPNWRGPQQNSTSTEKNLVDKWSPKGGANSNLLWKRSDLGTRSTPIVMRGKLYVLVRDKPGTADETEKVVCADADTGKQRWEHRMKVYLTDVPKERLGWSAVVGDPTTGRVYAQGVAGLFCCLDGETGKVLWQHNLVEEYGTISTFGGRTNFPIMFDDTVLISAILVGWGDTPEFDGLAKPAHRFMAFDKATGELRWLNGTSIGPPDTNYSTPVAKVVGGEAQLIFGSGDGKVWSFQPRTGTPLWNFPLSVRSINTSPIVVGTTVYCGHSEENIIGSTQGSIVALDATMRGDLSGKEKWNAYTLMAGKSSPVMVGNQLWAVTDSAKLQVLDPATGKQIGKKSLGAVMRSTPLYADGKVYTCTNSGIWYVLKPTDGDPQTLQKIRLGSQEQSDGSPIVSHGRIYLPTNEALYCIGVKNVKPEADPLPAEEQEPPISANQAPAKILLAPYDVLLKPKESKKFTARIYNAKGQLLRVAKPEELTFRVSGPGEVTADGTYTAPKREEHVGALVYAKLGNLEGKARVRIVPPLPWSFNFNKGDIPITWIGGRVRYVMQDLDGDRVLKKLDVLPTPRSPNNKLGTRSQLFMGSPDMKNYTIQADFRLTEKNKRLPDCGVINSGYSLVIRSGDKVLRLYSWNAHEFRTSAEAPLDAQPGVWYRLKLTANQVNGKAEVKGKLWRRDQPEPKDWTVQLTDNTPIESGSPGIYGHSQEAEFYMDNVSVTANE